MKAKYYHRFTQSKMIYLGLIVLALIIAFCCYDNSPVKTNEKMEDRMLMEVNNFRVSKTLNVLSNDARIAGEARKHSVMMAKGEVPVGHVDSYKRFESLDKDGVTWITAAENVVCVPRSKNSVFDALQCWKSTRQYQENMEGEYNLTGIGIAQKRSTGDFYITEIFVKTK